MQSTYHTAQKHTTHIMQYHIGPLRKFQFLMLPIFAGVFFIIIAYLVTVSNPVVDYRIYLVLGILFLGVSFLPFLFFYNFNKANEGYVLETEEEQFRLFIDNKKHQIKYSEIDRIEEYLNGKVTPWYYCEYWIVKAKGEEFLITSLLISRNDFFVRFPVEEKLHRNERFLPFVK